MTGWSHEKRVRIENMFFRYLDHCAIDSKDLGHVCLGDVAYDGQIKLVHDIFDALEQDIHSIYVLKARQLGISTIVRALTVFLLGISPGLSGALVFDTAPNRENARQELVTMIRDLPARIKFPQVKGTGEGNRESIALTNNARMRFFSAGVKKSKSSGTLGRSVGLAFATLSELCSYDNEEGLAAFQESLSDINPDRLYIYESTARGYNSWYSMWRDAREDTTHCRCIFLGWWSKGSQMIPRDSPDFERYGTQPPTKLEAEKITQVYELYGHEITPEQLAWIRRKYDPNADVDGDAAEVEYIGSSTKVQEQPWTEAEAFQNTGAVFFVGDKLTEQSNYFVSPKYSSYIFTPGQEFSHMTVHKSPNEKSTELKVWEEPDPEGVYCFGVDPAFGENADNDRAAIEVFRCYADGIDQVAEFASPLPTPQQLAWILTTMMGWYGIAGPKTEVRYILELNGPGTAVFNEIKQVRFQIERGYWPQIVNEMGLKNVFSNVRTFIYARPDGMTSGNNYHFKTNVSTKVMVLEHLRDYVHNLVAKIRSYDLVEEMKSIARDGDSIAAPAGGKDDRVLATALVSYQWQSSMRRNLIIAGKTREAAIASKRQSIVDRVAKYNEHQLTRFFSEKRTVRAAVRNEELRKTWRYRR